MKLLSLFSGIGAFEKAFYNLGVDIDLVGFSEVDKWAIKSYCAIHDIDETLNLGNVTSITTDDIDVDVDTITHGSPCQDFSVLGRNKGGDKGSGTRSSLMWNTVSLIEEIRPRYVFWENVKGVLFPSNIHNFEKYLLKLKKLGYNNYWKVINSVDHGVPQHRERIYVVSIREDVGFGSFKFPEPRSKRFVVEDFLFSDKSERKCKSTLKKYFDPLYFEDYKTTENGMIKLFDGVAQEHFTSSFVDNRIYSIKGTSPTFTTRNNHHFYEIGGRLTPIERFVMQGFTKEDFNKIEGVSDTQLEKQIGNSITVNVLEDIYKNIF